MRLRCRPDTMTILVCGRSLHSHQVMEVLRRYHYSRRYLLDLRVRYRDLRTRFEMKAL